MAVIMVSMIAMLHFALPLVGGFDTVFENSADSNFMNNFQWAFFPVSEAAAHPEFEKGGFNCYMGHMGWFYWLASIMAIGLGSIAAQDLSQRMLSAKEDENTSVPACILSGGSYLVMGLIPVILGMIAFKIYPDLEFSDIQNRLLLIMAADHLPVIMTVLFVCGLVAALMSSAAAAVLAASAIVGYNGLKAFRPNASDATSLKVIRAFIPIVTAAALVLALRFETLYNLMVVAWSVLLVSLFAPYTAVLFWKKANGLGALAAFMGGFAGWIFAYFQYLPYTIEAATDVVPGVEGVYFDWAMWDALYIASVWGLIASITRLVVVSPMTRKSDRPRPLVDTDGNPMQTQGWFGLSRGVPADTATAERELA